MGNPARRTTSGAGGDGPAGVADIARAAEAIAGAGYFNAGQDCTAATRVRVAAAVYDEFVPALTEQARATRTGMPDDPGVLYGALNNAEQIARVAGIVDRLPEHARVQIGGTRRAGYGYFYEPTVLSGLCQDDEQVQDEIFGPVITVQRFTAEAEALRCAKPTSECEPPIRVHAHLRCATGGRAMTALTA